MRARFLLVVALCAGSAAFAEQAAVNFHLEPMVGTGLDKSLLVTGASLKLNTTLIKPLGPLAPQLEFFGAGAADRTYFDDGAVFGGGLGLRLRLFNDEQGFFFNPGTTHTGNLWGNLWVDAHFTYSSGAFGPGFNVGVGTELSLVEGLSVGPFAKYMFFRQREADPARGRDADVSPHHVLMFGISFTIGAPQTTPAQADYDRDGVRGGDDKCIDDPEDVDGFEDTDGCPEKDNDKDGIEDAADKCPTEAEDKDTIADTDGCPEGDSDADGVLDVDDKCPTIKGPGENKGCPDEDKDGDTVLDRLDQCLDLKGAPENKGCPDTDADKDGVVDRLDECREAQGPADNKGCPYPDTDKDGVSDNLDNCLNEVGTVENGGCPANKRQLVVIGAGRLDLRDKVYFDNGKATVQRRSFALLDQVASILIAHGEIKRLQVEGHTDNAGNDELNRKLSDDRARAVVDYLVKKGVAADRLKPIGFGPDRPIGDNSLPQGREQNRRVEFHVVQD